MVNTELMWNSKVRNEDICSSCADNNTCVFIKHKHKPVLECELFVTEGKKMETALSSRA